jgi:hypothetical protein
MGPAPTIETRRIETAPGFVFDVSVAGPDDAALVLMLHGFCVSCPNCIVRPMASSGTGHQLD